MTGETDLKRMLQALKPQIDEISWVFVTIDLSEDKNQSLNSQLASVSVAMVVEEEGISWVIPKQEAQGLGLKFSGEFHKITLNVHSSLEAIGLTAAVSGILAKHQIPANVIAGFYHDHIFVPKEKAVLAFELLTKFEGNIEDNVGSSD